MIKKILLALAVIIPTCAFAQVKVGVVDAEAVMSAMPEYKEAEAKLTATSKTYEDQLSSLQSEFEKKVQEYQAMPETDDASKMIKEDRAKELESLQQRIQTFYSTAQQEMQRQQQLFMQPIQEKFLTTIKEYGKEQGFLMIIPTGVAIFTSDDVVDVTSGVKAKLGIH